MLVMNADYIDDPEDRLKPCNLLPFISLSRFFRYAIAFQIFLWLCTFSTALWFTIENIRCLGMIIVTISHWNKTLSLSNFARVKKMIGDLEIFIRRIIKFWASIISVHWFICDLVLLSYPPLPKEVMSLECNL